jgi:putative aminopeptidase FrvX
VAPLLQELLWTYGPCGHEEVVRDIRRRELEPLLDKTWVDAGGNLVALVHGDEDKPGGQVTRGPRVDFLSIDRPRPA